METMTSAQLAQLLYVAYYGRPADSAGQQFWADQIDAVGTAGVAADFGTSAEFEARFGELSNEELVNNLYQQLFGREGEEAGVDYWVNLLESGTPLAQIALEIANGAQNDDITAINNKVAVAQRFTDLAGEEYSGDEAANSARDFLLTIDAETDVEAVDVQAAVDALVEAPASDLTEGLAALETANTALAEAEESLVELLVEAEIIADADAFDPEALEDYAAAAEVNVQEAIRDLANARATATDAALQQNVTVAQTAVNNNALGDDTISDTPATTRYDAAGDQLVPLFFNAAAVDADKWKTQAELDAADPALTGYSLAGYQTDGATAPIGGTDTPSNYAGFESTVFTARQLQQRVDSAQATLNAHEANNGDTLELAGALNDAIALYLSGGGDDIDFGGDVNLLGAIQTTYAAVVAQINEDGTFAAGFDAALTAWSEAITDAQAALVDETAPAELDDIGTRDDAVASQLAVLDKRVELIAELDARETAFFGTEVESDGETEFQGGVGSALANAQAALEARDGLKETLETAQQQQTDLAELTTAYETAVEELAAAEEALGFAVEKLDSGIEFATDEADLFTFDLSDFINDDGVVTLENVIINGASTDDLLFFFGDYQLGTEGSADNNALEIFFTEVNGNAVIQVEASAFGSQTENFVEITLSGITQDQLSFDNGAVSIVEVA